MLAKGIEFLKLSFVGIFLGTVVPSRAGYEFRTSYLPKDFAYDPVTLSVAASMYSRLPARNAKEWKTVQLPAESVDPKSLFYKKSVQAYYRQGAKHLPLIVIFPGSFASSKRGSFVNQSVAKLDESLGDKAPILAFAGILTPEFLSFLPKEIPWDFSKPAADLHQRIMAFRQNEESFQKASQSVGLLGFSGGATLVVHLLAKDAQRQFFNLGGLAISPMLHPRIVFETIDNRYKEGSLEAETNFDSFDASTLWQLAKTRRLPSWEDILDLVNVDSGYSKTFRDRFYNDLITSCLKSVCESLEKSLFLDCAEDAQSYKNFFIRKGFSGSEKDFDAQVNLDSYLLQVTRPLMVYFAKDDPLLSTSHPQNSQPEEITQILQRSSKNKNLMILNPHKGAHAGVFFDDSFEKFLAVYFKK